MDIFLELLGFAETFVNKIQNLSAFFATPVTLSFEPFGTVTLASYAELILGSGLGLLLAFRVWKFFGDAVGL